MYYKTFPFTAPVILNGIQWSKKLDPIFKQNRKETSDLRWQYYCSADGFLRIYPGQKSIQIFFSFFNFIFNPNVYSSGFYSGQMIIRNENLDWKWNWKKKLYIFFQFHFQSKCSFLRILSSSEINPDFFSSTSFSIQIFIPPHFIQVRNLSRFLFVFYNFVFSPNDYFSGFLQVKNVSKYFELAKKRTSVIHSILWWQFYLESQFLKKIL